MDAMSTSDDDDFYVDDEPLESVRAAFHAGPHVVSRPPASLSGHPITMVDRGIEVTSGVEVVTISASQTRVSADWTPDSRLVAASQPRALLVSTR